MRNSLQELFEVILNSPGDCDSATIMEADGFLAKLQDFQLNFLLNIFEDIRVFSWTDVLFNVLQSKRLDITYY
jgi:hypothetical protein